MILGPAPGTESWCGSLGATMTIDEAHGGVVISSFWKPSPEELALLNANGYVTLNVHGSTHPIVSITTSP